MFTLQSIEENLASKQKEVLKALTEELEEKFKLQLEEKEKQVRDEMHKNVGRSFVSLHGLRCTAFSVKKMYYFLVSLSRLHWVKTEAVSQTTVILSNLKCIFREKSLRTNFIFTFV